MKHDAWLQPPEECETCGLTVCECDWEADQGDREYHEWKDDQLMDWGL